MLAWIIRTRDTQFRALRDGLEARGIAYFKQPR
ncbi:hypothetical protein GGQ88_002055 [Novosphingobium hassiacum]|uniref:Uncharacterized protein n=1 Tax=Novosphingobium hassiacum TaxID=173676 RepID=A0A7W5ZWG7_9SPHN|nr:hypothetical protein [Novosphingobium hassiacum]